jgi:hypothetical protein
LFHNHHHHHHHHLSAGAGTVGQTVAAVSSGLSLTHEKYVYTLHFILIAEPP